MIFDELCKRYLVLGDIYDYSKYDNYLGELSELNSFCGIYNLYMNIILIFYLKYYLINKSHKIIYVI